MKKVLIVAFMLVLSGCNTKLPSYILSMAEKACADKGGIHSLDAGNNILYSRVTCNNGTSKVLKDD